MNEILESLPGAIGAVAAVFAAWVARSGLHTWRAQLRGNYEYTAARQTLRAVLAVRDAIGQVRAPFISAGEAITAFKEAGVDLETVKLPGDTRTDQLVFERRWKPLVAASSELEAQVLEAEVLFGASAQDAHKALRRCLVRLNFAVQEYLRTRSDPEQWRAERSAGTMDRTMNDLFDTSSRGESDGFRKDVESAVADFEKLLRPHLRLGV